MKIQTDDIQTAVESESGLRALLQETKNALEVRARANESDATTIESAGYLTEASRQRYEADARIRNAELVGFVIDNLHSYEPPAAAAVAAAVSVVAVSESSSESNEEPSSELNKALA